MGVYVKGMRFPKSCGECDFENPFAEKPYCRRLMKQTKPNMRLDGCPLVKVPKYARLIDANRFEVIRFTGTEGRADTFDEGVMWLSEQIDNAPTVIESED